MKADVEFAAGVIGGEAPGFIGRKALGGRGQPGFGDTDATPEFDEVAHQFGPEPLIAAALRDVDVDQQRDPGIAARLDSDLQSELPLVGSRVEAAEDDDPLERRRLKAGLRMKGETHGASDAVEPEEVGVADQVRIRVNGDVVRRLE